MIRRMPCAPLALLAAACARPGSAEQPTPKPLRVQAEPAQAMHAGGAAWVAGTLLAAQRAVVSTRIAARVRTVRAREPQSTVPLERPETQSIPAPEAAPDARAHAREMGELLQGAIRSLSEKQREVLVLRDVEGVSAEEAAQLLGIHLGALKSRLHRARAALRERLVAALGDDGEMGELERPAAKAGGGAA